MAKTGRKAKPPALKLLTGNPGCRPVNKDYPKPKPIAPKCPTWLSKDAKKEWKRVVPELEKLTLATGIDLGVLATYCQAWADYQDAQMRMHAPGHGIIVMGTKGLCKHPAWQVSRDAAMLMLKCSAELGMTPSARGQMKIAPTKDDNPLEEFLSRGKTSKTK